jgi:putative flippase GtrA
MTATIWSMAHLRQYLRFMAVGAFVAVMAIGARELIAAMFTADTTLSFSVSVALAYALGIALSYVLNSRFTFRAANRVHDWRRLAAFITIAGVGMVSTWILSLTIRYVTPVGTIFGRASAAAAFAFAALLSSLLTYPLNARWVFHPRTQRN